MANRVDCTYSLLSDSRTLHNDVIACEAGTMLISDRVASDTSACRREIVWRGILRPSIISTLTCVTVCNNYNIAYLIAVHVSLSTCANC